MKNIQYIIGILAILAIVIMNFAYAHNNYNISKMSHISKVAATTTAPTYREELEVEYQFCDSYAYDVVVYGKYAFGTHRVTFYSKSMKEAYNTAKSYTQEVNQTNTYYAEVDRNCYITKSYREAHRVKCLQSGNLRYCETHDAICDPLEYESNLER